MVTQQTVSGTVVSRAASAWSRGLLDEFRCCAGYESQADDHLRRGRARARSVRPTWSWAGTMTSTAATCWRARRMRWAWTAGVRGRSPCPPGPWASPLAGRRHEDPASAAPSLRLRARLLDQGGIVTLSLPDAEHGLHGRQTRYDLTYAGELALFVEGAGRVAAMMRPLRTRRSRAIETTPTTGSSAGSPPSTVSAPWPRVWSSPPSRQRPGSLNHFSVNKNIGLAHRSPPAHKADQRRRPHPDPDHRECRAIDHESRSSSNQFETILPLSGDRLA